MKQGVFTITGQRLIAKDVYEIRLHGDIGAITAPGQFVNVALPGFTLRRPISVCNIERDDGCDPFAVLTGEEEVPGTLTLVYKVVGEGKAYACADGALLAVVTDIEALEEVFHLIGRDSFSCVADDDADVIISVVRGGFDGDLPVFCRVFEIGRAHV